MNSALAAAICIHTSFASSSSAFSIETNTPIFPSPWIYFATIPFDVNLSNLLIDKFSPIFAIFSVKTSFTVFDESEIDTKTVQVGNTVKIKDLEFNEEEEYTIVGSTEVDLTQNKISNESPIGAALIGAKKGEEIEVKVPAGIVKYKIMSIKK